MPILHGRAVRDRLQRGIPPRRRRLDRRRRRQGETDQPTAAGDPRGRGGDFTYLIMPIRGSPTDRPNGHAPQLPVVRAARARHSSRASSSSRARTGPGRRTCSRPCMWARRASRHVLVPTQQLVRFGAAAARDRARGRPGRPARRAGGDARERAGKRAKLNGAPLRSAEQLRGEVATLVFTPDRLAVVKGGPAARRAYFDRDARAAAARPRIAPGRVRGRSRAAERGSAPGRVRSFVPRCDCAVDGAGGEPRRLSGRVPPRGDRASRARFRRTAQRSSACRQPRSTTAASRRRRRARGAAGARPGARRHRPRPAPRRRQRPLRRAGPPELRLAGRAATGRSFAPARRGGGDRRARSTPPLVLLDECSRSSTRPPPDAGRASAGSARRRSPRPSAMRSRSTPRSSSQSPPAP